MSGDDGGRPATLPARVLRHWLTVDGARRMRTLRAIAATAVFVGFGAAAHRLGVGVPVQPIPKLIIAVLVAPLLWLLLPATVSVPRAFLAAFSAQAVLHVALLGMEPSSGGSAPPVHLHQDLPVGPVDGSGHLGGSALSVPLVQAHVMAAMLTCVLLLVADDVLRAVVRSDEGAANAGSADEAGAPGDRQPHVKARPRPVRRSETPWTVHHSVGWPARSWYPAAVTHPSHVRMPPLIR